MDLRQADVQLQTEQPLSPVDVRATNKPFGVQWQGPGAIAEP